MLARFSPSIRRFPAGRLVLSATLLAGACLAPIGCAGYANYPSIGEDAAINDPNHPPIPDVMAEALRYTVEKFPVEGEYVVNLPPGIQKRWAERLLKRLEDPNARLVTPGTENLPAYHVTQVWIRGDSSTVEVVRPVPTVKAGAEGPAALTYQSLRLKLRGAGSANWRVRATRAWTIGAAEPPRLYGWAD